MRTVKIELLRGLLERVVAGGADRGSAAPSEVSVTVM